MIRKLALLLLLIPCMAQAGELRVTINMAPGSDPLSYKLTATQTRDFWQRWRTLNPSNAMPPLPNGQDYGGLTLDDDDFETEVRLFNGVGRSGESARTDDFRQLERWVLGFAPPPLGPSLVAALDSDVRAMPGGAQVIPQNILSGNAIAATCTKRAGRNMRLRATCLNQQLLEQLDPADYVSALEQLARQKLPVRPGSLEERELQQQQEQQRGIGINTPFPRAETPDGSIVR